MYSAECFEILEIEPTADKRLIRRAYAQAVKKCHPEENPAQWQRVHAAYETALHRAEQCRADSSVPKESRLAAPAGKAGWAPEADAAEEETPDFAGIPEAAARIRQQEERMQDEALDVVLTLLQKTASRTRPLYRSWKKLLEHPMTRFVRTDPGFLYRLGDAVAGKYLSRRTCALIGSFLRETRMELLQDVPGSEVSRAREALASAEKKLEEKRTAGGRLSRQNILLCVFVLVTVSALLSLFIT